MIYTNNYNLPETIYKVLTQDTYDLSNQPDNLISVSTLLQPPNIAVLQRRHVNELTEDISESLWRVFGSAVHKLYECITDLEGYIPEKRFYYDWTAQKIVLDCVDNSHFYITGKVDLLNTKQNKIEDYKVTSVYTIIYNPDGKHEWIEQLNCYAFLARKAGFDVQNLQINSILRDWNKKDTAKKNYPTLPIHIIDLPVWSDDVIYNFINNKIQQYDKMRQKSDQNLDCCDEKDQWINKAGEALRCERYCNVKKWCNKYLTY